MSEHFPDRGLDAKAIDALVEAQKKPLGPERTEASIRQSVCVTPPTRTAISFPTNAPRRSKALAVRRELERETVRWAR